MKRPLIIFLLIFMAGLISFKAVAASRQEVVGLFFEGNSAYKKGDFKKAVESYEEIIKKGDESGPVYFNLANSYFKENQLGKAILNYERALKIIPRDSDLKFNYKYAVSLRQPSGEVSSMNLFERFSRAHKRYYTVDEMVIILIGLIFLLGAVYLGALYAKWPMATMRFIFILIVVFIFIFGYGLNGKLIDQKGQAIVIKASQAKFEPRAEATVHFGLPEGSKVSVVKREGDWIKIKRPDGKLGWIEAVSLEEI